MTRAVVSESVWPIRCAACGVVAFRALRDVNRAEKRHAPLYCSKACSDIARRGTCDKSEKVAAKAAYDAAYRAKNRAMLKAKKAAYYAATADREKERIKRQARMPQHVEYCRRPEYRKWKADYDRKYIARKQFGAFGEAAIILNQLETEILTRATRYEIYVANGIVNKKLQRRRDYDQTIGS